MPVTTTKKKQKGEKRKKEIKNSWMKLRVSTKWLMALQRQSEQIWDLEKRFFSFPTLYTTINGGMLNALDVVLIL